MRPVGKMCQYESLLDGKISLADIALMNDWLNVQDDNKNLVKEYQDRNQGNG